MRWHLCTLLKVAVSQVSPSAAEYLDTSQLKIWMSNCTESICRALECYSGHGGATGSIVEHYHNTALKQVLHSGWCQIGIGAHLAQHTAISAGGP